MECINSFIDIVDTPFVIWKYNIENKRFFYSNANKAFLKEFNVFLDDKENCKMKYIYKFYKKEYFKTYLKCIKKKETQNYEIYNDGKKIIGTIIYIDESYILEKLEIINITEHTALNDPFNMILIVYNKKTICNANFLFLRNTEYTKTNIINKEINDIFTEKVNFEKENIITNNNIILADKKVLNVDLYIIHLNGIYDIIIIKDVSIVKKDIINNKIMTHLDTSIIIFDKDIDNEYFESYKCTDTNKSFLETFKKEKIIGECILNIFDEKIYFMLKKAYTELLINDNYLLHRILFKDRYYDFNCFMVNKGTFGIIIIDITDSIEIKTIKYARDNFLINIIENLRKPIIGISNSLSHITETEMNPVQRDYINDIINYNYMLSLIISDFTDYANLKLGKVKVENEYFNIRNEIDSFYEGIILKRKDIDIIFDIDSKTPPYIITDKYKLMQIIRNLVNNAMKFTENGKITLKIYTEKINTTNEIS